MNSKLFYFLVLAAMSFACQMPSDLPDDTGGNPRSAFEGKWKWLKTDGSGVAGPYHADSVTVGYSMMYEFSFTELQVYKNGVPAEQFTYTYTVSEETDKQRLTLKNKSNGAEVIFLCELKTVDSADYLLLRNTEPCCDNTFEHQFKLISRPG